MVYRLIAPPWLADTGARRVLEGEFTAEQLQAYNAEGYNCFFLPNGPSAYTPGTTVSGTHIDDFRFVFVDMDLKDKHYESKDAFIDHVLGSGIEPTYVVDSGNGVHVYFEVSDLDAMSYLRLQRRLMRKFNTDEATTSIYQLMRLPGTLNTKDPDNLKPCEYVYQTEQIYTCESLSKLLPPITHADEQHCQQHYQKTYDPTAAQLTVDEKLPSKFSKLIRENNEVKSIWSGEGIDDRSIADFRLGHIMFANGFTREEARSVLVNSAKAITRAPVHRIGYADNIVDKIWTFEEAAPAAKAELMLSASVKDILSKSTSEQLKGTRFRCYPWIDGTEHGFRLGQVFGLVAGSKVGKTAVAMNLFRGFTSHNPDYDHFLVPLEQPGNELAERWRVMCGEDTSLHSKVQILSNYADDGTYRNFSLKDIKEYILKYQQVTGRKVGCVVIDHIGVLRADSRNGENNSVLSICKEMKSFAVETNTFLIMQSQAPREKAGSGDLELNKDSAYGSVFFESFCDFLVTLWQPLKLMYKDPICPTVSALKFCAIRSKNQKVDRIKEDVCYRLFFESETGLLREMTQAEEESFKFFNNRCVNKRKEDRKTSLVEYTSIKTGSA